MIEGLKVTITGAELRELCLKRSDHHLQRVEAYAAQEASMSQNQIEGMSYSGGDPKKVLTEKRKQHEWEASELQFIATHLDPSEKYLLEGEDLIKLGICKSRY